jgi:hypothetical protein
VKHHHDPAKLGEYSDFSEARQSDSSSNPPNNERRTRIAVLENYIKDFSAPVVKP